MKKDRKTALVLMIRGLCSVLFVATAIVSVGARLGRAADAQRLYGSFAEVSFLTPPASPAPTDPSPSEPSDSDHTNPTNSSSEQEPADPTPDEEQRIVPVNISMYDGSGDILFKNETAYTFDTASLLGSGYPIESVGADQPAVLILHTHATESYTEEGARTVTATRSNDSEKNMIAVGKTLADTLNANGVNTIHCTTAHDAESFNESYTYAADSVKSYLEKYPSIRYIIDVHRDAIETADGSMAKPVIETDGRSLAQLMLVVGTNEGGADHPGWKTNLCVATRTQEALIAHMPELARPINLRRASFNQQYAPGFLLLEIGTCANTLSEAKASAAEFGKVFAELIKNP